MANERIAVGRERRVRSILTAYATLEGKLMHCLIFLGISRCQKRGYQDYGKRHLECH